MTKRCYLKIMYLLALLGLLTGCLSDPNSSGKNPRSGTASDVSNTSNSVPAGHGRLLLLSPIAQSGDQALSKDVNLNTYLNRTPIFITNSASLESHCVGNGLEGNLDQCLEGKGDSNSNLLAAVQNKWAFDANSDAFAQLNAFGNTKLITERFLGVLKDGFNSKAKPFDSLNTYLTAIPNSLYTTKAHWNGGLILTTLGLCEQDDNASFDVASFSICMGSLTDNAPVKMAHDPSVIYHEVGHALHYMMLNFRNIAAPLPIIPERVNIGYNSYDESAALSEGFADFMSHYMDGRSRMGEWGLGRFLNAARPVTEADALHIPGISTEENSRIFYPDFLNYEPNQPASIVEGVHNGGIIFSHFLTAFAKEMRDYCNMTFIQSVDTTLYLNMEAFSELGDLTASASDHSKASGSTRPTINHSASVNEITNIRTSEKWVSTVLPISYRSWSQKFAKYAYQILSKNGSLGCNGVNYPTDKLERLLDSYGLLLFDNYNEDGNNHNLTIGQSGTSRQINIANRIKTVLVSKNQIKIDTRPNKSAAFIFDKRSEVLSSLGLYQQFGIIGSLSHIIPSDLPYNNGNGQISPGEIIGIGLNIYNDSNSEIGGVQLLANDWDHAKITGSEYRPCNIFEDAWPLKSEGAADVSTEDLDDPDQGNCHFTTRLDGNPDASTGGDHPAVERDEVLAPICYVQVKDNGVSRWADQNVLRERLGVEPSQCLSGALATHDCFIRTIRGIDSAWYSRIAAKKTWGETVVDEIGSPSFGPHNAVFMEASPDIPPGTTFECRFRIRFSNCKECFTDLTSTTNTTKDDYRDFEYSGAKPFKIVRYQFTVID